jgi:hypothetical protein
MTRIKKLLIGFIAVLALVDCVAVGALVAYMVFAGLMMEKAITDHENSYSYQPVQTDVSASYQPVPTDVSAIEADADIKLPPSAREIYSYLSGFRYVDTLVRFSMKAEELDQFLAVSLCDQPLAPISPASEPKLEGNPTWWVPFKAKMLEECYGKNEHSHQHILVDQTDSNIYIIYVSDSTY